MNETLFIQSPITLVLSLVAIILAASYSAMMGQKIKVSSLPFAVRYLVITIIAWNILAFVGTLFFSGNHPGLGGQIVFGLQAMIWIQAGNTIYKVALLNLHSKSKLLWNIFNIFGVVLAAVSTAILCLHPALITDFSLFGHQPFAHRPNFVLFSIFFFIFVFPELLRSIVPNQHLHDGSPRLLRHHPPALRLFYSLHPARTDQPLYAVVPVLVPIPDHYLRAILHLHIFQEQECLLVLGQVAERRGRLLLFL